MNKKIEAEGGEIVLMDENGNYAIIPKNLRESVLKHMSTGCNDCISKIVRTLPHDPDKASGGGQYSTGDAEIDKEFNSLSTKYVDYGWDSLNTDEQNKYRTYYEMATKSANTIKTTVKSPKLDNDFLTYSEAPHISNIKLWQQQNNLPVTGVVDRKTEHGLKIEGAAIEDQAKLHRIQSARTAYQNKVKESGLRYTEKDFFGMNPAILEQVAKTNPEVKTHQCIGGVCNFLKANDPTSIQQEYYSNYDFEKAAKKEGWLRYGNTQATTPDIGDIIIVDTSIGGKRSKHAKIIIDADDKNYTTLDNDGGDRARIKQVGKSEIIRNVDKGTSFQKYNFYRRTKYNNEDASEVLSNIDAAPIPTKYKTNTYPISKLSASNQNERLGQYFEGINQVLSTISESDIPQEDLKKLVKIAGTLPKNESEYGTGIKYNIERNFPIVPKIARGVQRNINISEPLSTGLSQINPKNLPESIKDKYFKDMNDNQIARKIAKNEVVAGAVTLELMMDRYRYYRDNPALYNDNPSRFWYGLIKSWQSPHHAKTEKGKKLLDDLNIEYSENILKDLHKTTITE